MSVEDSYFDSCYINYPCIFKKFNNNFYNLKNNMEVYILCIESV